MTRALVVHAWRQVARETPRVAILVAAVVLPVLEQALSASSSFPLAAMGWIPLLALAGTCGADIRSGTLRAVLARPVSRFHYLVSRWVAGASLALALVSIQLAASFAAAWSFGTDGAPPLRAVGYVLAASAATCVAQAAWFTSASALLPGIADAVLLILLRVLALAAGELLPVGRQIVSGILLVPLLIIDGRLPPGSHPLAGLIVVLSNAGVVLGVGAILFNRRQVPPEAVA